MKGIRELKQELFEKAEKRGALPQHAVKALILLMLLALAVALWLWWPRDTGGDFALVLASEAGGDGLADVSVGDVGSADASTPALATGTPLDEPPASDATAPKTVVVYVSGAVGAPGLYELQEGARIGDAVAAAGGMRADASQEYVNLAAPVEDGIQIHIPTVDEVQAGTVAATGNTGVSAGSGNSAGESGGAGAPVPAGKVNINTADVTALQVLSGIGPATAQKIVDYRTAHGPFKTVDELQNVSGIGEKKFAAIADAITVG